jgi:ABC-type sugar transport system ATPase subunit
VGIVEIENVVRRFGQVTAVDHVSIDIDEGEYVVFLGPSGCGKTTMLRLIAGLDVPDAGEIRIAGRVVTSSATNVFVPPQQRRIGLVFQTYALWPHMNVFDNIAFGLDVQKRPRREVRERVAEALSYMQLDGLGERYPHELSGGQQQRVALARMLVAKPEIYLMDEPLSNLDAKLRMEMRAELQRIHKDLGCTTIYVTHDQLEAIALGSRIIVLKDGKISQDGTAREVYERPANLFVARFVGSPAINLVTGTFALEGGRVWFSGDGLRIPAEVPLSRAGHPAVAAFRPEDARVQDGGGGTDTGAAVLEGTVAARMLAGSNVILHVDLPTGPEVRLVCGKDVTYGVRDHVRILVPQESVLFYQDAEDGALIESERERGGPAHASSS